MYGQRAVGESATDWHCLDRRGITGSSLNPAVEINAVSGGDRVDQGLELGGRVLVGPGSQPPVEGDGGGEPGADRA